MSRIGRKLVAVPDGVTITATSSSFAVAGPKGEITMALPRFISVQLEDKNCRVVSDGDSKKHREMHGTIRSCLLNMVIGVTVGYKKVLEINGIGYRADADAKNLTLNIGKNHPVLFPVPDGIQITVEKNTRITVAGINKEFVGAAAARIRSFYPPEPYKGKGIKYQNETVRRKAGKTVAGG